MYYLWSTTMHGWWSTQSTYTSDFTEAQHFTRDEAIAMAKKFKRDAGYGMLPIADADLKEI